MLVRANLLQFIDERWASSPEASFHWASFVQRETWPILQHEHWALRNFGEVSFGWGGSSIFGRGGSSIFGRSTKLIRLVSNQKL